MFNLTFPEYIYIYIYIYIFGKGYCYIYVYVYIYSGKVIVEKMHQKKANAKALCKIWLVPFLL